VIAKKKLALLKYNAKVKWQYGIYNPAEEELITERSINLLDFENHADYYLIEEFSDSSEYGGESSCTLENSDSSLKMKGQLRRERSDLLPIDYMFAGFKCQDLVQHKFTYFNGFRVTMRPPALPCRFGIVIEHSLRNFDYFQAHIIDTNNQEKESFISYEIPVRLMVNAKVNSRMVKLPAEVDELNVI